MPITEEEYYADLLFLSFEQEQPDDIEVELEAHCTNCGSITAEVVYMLPNDQQILLGLSLQGMLSVVYPYSCGLCLIGRLKPYSTRHNE